VIRRPDGTWRCVIVVLAIAALAVVVDATTADAEPSEGAVYNYDHEVHGALRAATSLSTPVGAPTERCPRTSGLSGISASSHPRLTPVLVAPNGPATFRGDSRSPTQVFDEGFQAVGDDLDLLRHAEGYPNSGYVSTSRSPTVAQDFGPNVYEVRAPGGIDVNDALGTSSPFARGLEVAYPGSIPSSCIVGCTLPNGQRVPNPSFGPR